MRQIFSGFMRKRSSVQSALKTLHRAFKQFCRWICEDKDGNTLQYASTVRSNLKPKVRYSLKNIHQYGTPVRLTLQGTGTWSTVRFTVIIS